MIVDTDVLIWYLRGDGGARRFLARLPFSERTVSALTVMELLQGCRDPREVRDLGRFVAENVAAVIHPDESTSRRAIQLLEMHAARSGLRAVDALIAAAALEAGTSLATANVRHYRAIAGLAIVAFRPTATR